MAIKITAKCINCDAYISECPNHAIYEPDEGHEETEEELLVKKVWLHGA